MVCCLWFVVCGLLFVACGSWFVVCGLGFRVRGLGFRVWGLRFGIWGYGVDTSKTLILISRFSPVLRLRDSGSGFRVPSVYLKDHNTERLLSYTHRHTMASYF